MNSNRNIATRLIQLVKPLSGYMLLAILMGTIGHLCAAFLTIFGGYALLELLGFSVPIPLGGIFACLCVFAVLRGALHYAEQACNHYIAFKLLALIRHKVFAALRKLCPAKLDGQEKGNLITVITTDIELLEVFYAHTISPIAIAFLMSLLLSLFIGSFHWLLGLLAALAYLTIGVAIPILTAKKSGEDGMRLRTKAGELSSFVLDSLRGLSEILQYSMGKKRLTRMDTLTDELSGQEEQMKRRSGKSTAVTNTAILLFDFAMLLLAAICYQGGTVDFAGVLIPVIALMSSFGPVIALANLGSGLQSTFAAGRRVFALLDETPVVEEISGQKEIDFTSAKAEKLTFSYGGDTILSGVSVELPKNRIVGIVGQSGSGKSTLLKLLMRFWTAQKGEIAISNVPIGQINTENLREMESLVTQETHLFHDSIENNIRIAKLSATREEIQIACKKAAVHDFIMTLPKGYDTPVRELGDSLSGGERQRIGLARAFLHDAPLLLLDEPTSNLDSLNEALILRSIQQERGDKTVVLVSHRQSTMRIVDTVCSVAHRRNS